MTRIASLLCSLSMLVAPPVAAQTFAPPYNPNPQVMAGVLYTATSFGNCTWGTGTGNDAGPCINAAIAAAGAAGGGTVLLPCAYGISNGFKVATQIVQNQSGVHLLGCGVGEMRDNNATTFNAVTRLIWTGVAPQSISSIANSSGLIQVTLSATPNVANGQVITLRGVATNTNANGSWIVSNLSGNSFTLANSTYANAGGAAGTVSYPMFIETSGTIQTLESADVQGVVFDCNAIADTCAEFANVAHSKIDIGYSEPVNGAGVWFTTLAAVTDGPGTQDNDIWVQGRVTNLTNTATGVAFDGCSGCTYNVSMNRIHSLRLWTATGDGVVFGYSDNNVIDQIYTTRQSGVSSYGNACVFADNAYASPNGITVGNNVGSTSLYHDDCHETIIRGPTSVATAARNITVYWIDRANGVALPTCGAFAVGWYGTSNVPNLEACGAPPTASGTCAVTFTNGGVTNGTFTSNAACLGGTVTLTFNITSSQTSTTGWRCKTNDLTNPQNQMVATSSTTSAVTLTGNMATNDAVTYDCQGY